jgi:hypothetical protein
MWRWVSIAMAVAASTAPARAHEGATQRLWRASARGTAEGGVALDVMIALSLARTPSLLAIAQLDLNHDGRFDLLETALAEAALGDRPDHGLVVALDGRPVRPVERAVAVQLDAQGKHVSVAVLATYVSPAPARISVSLTDDGSGVPALVVSPAPGIRLDGRSAPATCAAGPAPCVFSAAHVAP